MSSASDPQAAMQLIVECIRKPPNELTDLILEAIQKLRNRLNKGNFQSVAEWNAYLATLARMKSLFVIATMEDETYIKKFLPLFRNSESLVRYQLPAIADYIIRQRQTTE